MANYVKILIRRDTTANWASSNPVLALGEIGADMELHRLKVGNGTSKWTELPFFDSDIVDALTSTRTDAGASANQARELKAMIDNLKKQIAAGGTEIIDNLESTSKDSALSANQGRVLNGKITEVSDLVNGFGPFGMGYEIKEFNQYSKPTKIEFEDGLTATLAWSGGTQLRTITSSTGYKQEILYDENGRVIGRKITRAA